MDNWKNRPDQALLHGAMRRNLIRCGVKNLKQFGYPSVSESNILTDRIYSAFFKSMLQNDCNKVKGYEKIIEGLLKEIESKSIS